MRSIKLSNITVNYSITRKKRKTIALKIKEEGYVEVVTPLRVTYSYIEDLLRKKEQWLITTLEKINIIKAERDNISVALFLGKEYRLIKVKSLNNRTTVEVLEKEIRVSYFINKNEVRDILKRWYINKATEALSKKTKEFSAILKVSPNKITIKEQKTRYGSCSSKSNINYNWKIIMAPELVVDYLVVHELCHLVHFNHQKDFWNLVESVIPNYKECKDYLKNNGYKLKI